MKSPVRALGLTLLCAGLSLSADRTSISSPGIAPSGTGSQYFWKTTPVGNTAQIVTLFCRGCDNSPERPDLPLIAVLRDTLGDNDAENDRLTSVWLLTYAQPTLAQRIFSAVPFFYWRVGGGSAAASARDTAPLLDLTSLQRPMIRTLQRDVLQWLMLDSSTLPIRATSRAYRTNQADHLRLHLEEAISYLRDSPPAEDSSGLSPEQLHTLIARLELRKTLLGGFVNEREAARIGIDGGFERERIRSRNWELLRQCAEKTGLRFEALDLAGISGQYAILWFPLGESSEPVSGGLGPIWKLLDIKNPWRDERLKSAAAAPYLREVDEAGNLLPPGMSGVRQIKLLPISVYSLNYPKLPLLMVDFRGKLHIRWHEMTQRSINEVTAGVIGISHFANWYYYVAADLYDFIASRHGAATNQSERLDCYSQFRVAVALDHQLDGRLRQQLQQRVESLAVNPLESAPRQELKAAVERYAYLQKEAQEGEKLLRSVDKSRRAELARASETRKQIFRDNFLHTATLGLYTHRAPQDPANLARIDSYRRAQYNLSFLDQLAHEGTQPEVAHDAARIRHSVAELSKAMPQLASPELRKHAAATLERLQALSRDSALQAECSQAVFALRTEGLTQRGQIALKPSAVRVPAGPVDGLQ